MDANELKPSIWDKIARNTLSNLTGTMVSLVVGFFLMPFVIHHIGLTAYGLWMLVTSLVGYMGLLDLGLAPTLVKKSAELLAKNDEGELNQMVSTIFTLYLMIGILLGLAIFGVGFVIDEVFNIPSEYINIFKAVLWIVGLQVALNFPMSIWHGLMGGLQDFHVINGIIIITNLIKAFATVFLLMSGFGLISLIWLGFVLAVASWISSMFWVKYRIPYFRIKILRLKLRNIKELAYFSGAMFIWGIGGRILLQADKILIGLFLPIASITIYEVGARISNYSRTILYSALSTVMPVASELNARNEKIILQKLYLKGTKYLLIAYAVVVGALLLFGKEFINLWMGEGFEQSVWIMYALLIGSLFQSQNVVGYVMLAGMGILKTFTKVMIAYPIVNIILSVIFVLKWGLIGIAAATALTFFIIDTYFIFYATKIFEIRLLSLLKASHLSAAISIAPAIVIAYFVKPILNFNSWFRLSLGVLSFIAVCFILFWTLGTTSKERSALTFRVLGMFNQVKMRA